MEPIKPRCKAHITMSCPECKGGAVDLPSYSDDEDRLRRAHSAKFEDDKQKAETLKIDKSPVTLDRYHFEIEVTSRFVYGICCPIGNFNKLCRYDIATRKTAPCVAVPQSCSVLQIGNQIFISGGGYPAGNALSEFSEEKQGLVGKTPMKYARYAHASVAISEAKFLAICGHDGKANLRCCEEYSIRDNVWRQLPPLGYARYSPAAALSGEYVYVIGGSGGYETIERMDMREEEESLWERVTLAGPTAAEVSLSSYSAAFSISNDEIMVLVSSGGATKCGVYNTKAGTVKALSRSYKSGSYQYNQVCMIAGNAYIMGSAGQMHVYMTAEKQIEEIGYSDAAGSA